MSRDESSTTRRCLTPLDVASYLAATEAGTPPPVPLAECWPRVRGYELQSLVGSGGMGMVYKARHRELPRTVAIKTLRGAALGDDEFRERFRAEAEAVAKLQHPNIIQVFEIGTTDPRPGGLPASPYIALEFVDGGNLADRADDPWKPRDAARMVEKLARAAHAAHRLGVIHRDLKPANVLLTPDDEPKIADFGVAKQLGADDGQLTRAGNTVGTPEYMAPEQVCGGQPTPAIDTYALGVILYELLTGRVPFRGVDGAATMDLVWKQEPVSPRQLQPGLPKDLETICLKCLDKVPGRRYESAEALADDLQRWQDGRPILARPVGPAGRAVRWAGRNPTVAMLSVAVVVIALAGLSGVVWGWRQAHAHAAAERKERYRAEMVATSTAFRLHDAEGGRRSLDAAPVEYRGWEWHFFHGNLDTATRTQTVSDQPAFHGRLSPDGRWVTCYTAGVYQVWDAVENRLVTQTPKVLNDGRFHLSPDGALLAYVRDDGQVVLWDVVAGRQRAVLTGHQGAYNTNFTPDCRQLVTDSGHGDLRVWDTSTGERLRVIPANRGGSGPQAFTADGRRLFAPGGATFGFSDWEIDTGRLVRKVACPGRDVSSVLPTRDGQRLAVHIFQNLKELQLWRTAEDGPYAVLKGHTNNIVHHTFSPDETRLLTASLDQTVRLWDVATGRPLAVLRGHFGQVWPATFSPDGRLVASGSNDQTVRLWDAHTGDPLATLQGHTADVQAVAFTADGKTLRSFDKAGALKEWDVAQAERNHSFRGHTGFVYAAAVHPDGKRVASAAWDGTVRVWDADTGREHFIVRHDTPQVSSVAFHPNGRLLASQGRDRTVRVWDADTGRPVVQLAIACHGWLDGRLAFDPTGSRLAAAAGDGSIQVWDTTTWAVAAEYRAPDEPGREVAFSPDGRWLASVHDGGNDAVRLWDTTGREPVRLFSGHTAPLYTVAFHPNGQIVASGAIDGTVRLWDVASGRELAVLRQGSKVYDLAFTPDGSRLASAGSDGSIRLWDVATGSMVADLRGHRDYVHAVTFSPDGRRLVSGSGDNSLRVWDTRPPADPHTP